MSALPLAFTPLPPDALPGDAFEDVIVLPAAFTNTQMVVAAPGEYFFFPKSLLFNLATTAAAGTRTPFLFASDANGNVLYRIPIPSPQAPNITIVYTWGLSVGSGYTNGVDSELMPMPPQILSPGWKIGVQVNGLQVGDTGSGVLTVIKIPRSAPVGVGEPVLAPTPLVS